MAFVVPFIFAASAWAAPIDVDVDVVCKTTTYLDILVFFVTNYITHAATVPSTAGTKWYSTVTWTIVCVFLPFAGLGKSLGLFFRFVQCRKNDLEKALSRGALVLVKRSKHWKPNMSKAENVYIRVKKEKQDILEEEFFQLQDKTARIVIEDDDRINARVDPNQVRIHGGSGALPAGYELNFADFWDRWHLNLTDEHHLSSSQSWVKMVTSIAQLLYTSLTIYETVGLQLEVYGYAAYGLSVFPYLLQSLVNLAAVGMAGDYSCAYLIHTSILDEANGRAETQFSGMVGSPGKPEAAQEIPSSFCVRMKLEPPEASTEKEPISPTSPNPNTEQPLGDANVNSEDKSNSPRPITPLQNLNSYPRFHPKRRKTMAKKPEPPVLVITRGDKSKERIRLKLVAEDTPSDVEIFLPAATNHFVEKIETKRQSWDSLLAYSGLFATLTLVLFLPYLLTYLLTGFHKRSSSFSERGWMVAWTVANDLAILFFAPQFLTPYGFADLSNLVWILPVICMLIVPAVGGFVNVAKMQARIKTCSLGS